MKEQFNSTNIKKNIAKGISTITHTPLVAVPVFLIICYYLIPISDDLLIIGSISIFFGGLLPLMICYLWAKRII